MTLQDDMNALKMLARAAAEEQSNATRSANMIVISEMIRLLQAKGIISTTEISTFCSSIELAASAMQSTTPAVGTALTETTIAIRHAFGIDSSLKQ